MLECRLECGASSVVRATGAGPLRLVVTEPRGPCAHVVVAALGAGHLCDDDLELTIAVGPGATLLVTTQAQGRVLRGARGVRLRVTASVGSGALLSYLPEPMAVYEGGELDQAVEVTLADSDASVVLADALVAGRYGERWRAERVRSEVRVASGAGPVARDATLLDRRMSGAFDALAELELLAIVMALGPRAVPMAEALLSQGDRSIAASPHPSGAVARVASRRASSWSEICRVALGGNLAETRATDPLAGAR